MATAQEHRRTLHGDTGDTEDAGSAPSRGAHGVFPDGDELQVITIRTLHTFSLLCRRKYDLEFAAISGEFNSSIQPLTEVASHIADVQRVSFQRCRLVPAADDRIVGLTEIRQT
ncbi:hypothetical protein ABGB19_01865 [Mycobacterium sp. B14F4]|uniref:hypothetical protein n=1 Tax=Mycobacterium sp. B14F4 TaxID=3153565 RepID=UPI00325C5997